MRLILGRVLWRETVMLLGFYIWSLGEHAIEFLATATCSSLADVAVGIQSGDLLGERRRDKLIERHTVVLRQRLCAAAKRFRNVDV